MPRGHANRIRQTPLPQPRCHALRVRPILRHSHRRLPHPPRRFAARHGRLRRRGVRGRHRRYSRPVRRRRRRSSQDPRRDGVRRVCGLGPEPTHRTTRHETRQAGRRVPRRPARRRGVSRRFIGGGSSGGGSRRHGEVASRGLGRRGRGNADVRRRGRGAAESIATRVRSQIRRAASRRGARRGRPRVGGATASEICGRAGHVGRSLPGSLRGCRVRGKTRGRGVGPRASIARPRSDAHPETSSRGGERAGATDEGKRRTRRLRPPHQIRHAFRRHRRRADHRARGDATVGGPRCPRGSNPRRGRADQQARLGSRRRRARCRVRVSNRARG